MAASRSSKTSTKRTPSRKKAAKATRSKKAASKRKAPAAKKAATKKTVRKKAAATAKPKVPTIETLARKIVKAGQDPEALSIEALYCEDVRSFESGDVEPVVGHEGLRQKFAAWEELLAGATLHFTPRNIFTKRNSICIEWDGVIKTAAGEEVRMNEVAIHEIRGGKIAEERYYYDRAALAALAPERSPAESMPSAAILDEPTGSPPDPLDL